MKGAERKNRVALHQPARAGRSSVRVLKGALMKRQRIFRRFWIIAASLAVGTVPSECEVRIHDSIIDATKLTFVSLLDPANFGFGTVADDADGG